MLSPSLKAKIGDLCDTSPLVVWFGIGIVGLLRESRTLLVSRGDLLGASAQFANVVFLALLILLLIIRRAPVRTSRGVLPIVAGIGGFFLPNLVLILSPATLSGTMSRLSFSLILLGAVISITAAYSLGRSFSILPQARSLVTEGPYRFIRHPLYLAELIAELGVVLQYEQPWSGLVMLLAIGAQLPRMHFEEQILTEAFPAYREYADRTARLIPGVY